jgi:uncharacterized protein YdiU (UPF0061 family)
MASTQPDRDDPQGLTSTLDALTWHQPLARYGQTYGRETAPTPLGSPTLEVFNSTLAADLGIDPAAESRTETAEILAGGRVPEGATPFAQLYAGHQFGVWVPQLGDGRAISLGQIRDRSGRFRDIQLKGAGLTPYSRTADGRAVLRSTIREYLASEALHALGIPTTRALSLCASPDPVYRETVETAAVLARVAPSHIRFGSFEVLFYRKQFADLKPLADRLIEDHFPAAASVSDPQDRYAAWVGEVIERTADLIARWQAVGFCHGVMNTDNMSALGLTIDYGPYGFMDAYEPGWICNHTDHIGRYAYDQQPDVGLWNLSRFVQAILPLLADEPDPAVEIGQSLLEAYRPRFVTAYMAQFRAKLGLSSRQEQDGELLDDLLALMARDKADFTRSFRSLSDTPGQADHGNAPFHDEFSDREAAARWLARWRARLEQDGLPEQERQGRMRAANPRYVLRNYLAQQAIEAAQAGDFSVMQRLGRVLERPFDEQPEHAELARLPPDWARHISVSCSS